MKDTEYLCKIQPLDNSVEIQESLCNNHNLDTSAVTHSDKLINDGNSERVERVDISDLDTNLKCDKNVVCDSENKCPFLRKEYSVVIDDCANVSEHFLALRDSDMLPGDCGYSITDKPDWLDMDKFENGREFYKKYTSSILMSNLMSLFIMFIFPGGLKPLVFTGESDTPVKAFKRYLSTSLRVTSWYDTDIWNPKSEGHKNLRVVRFKHEQVRMKMNGIPRDEAVTKGTLENPVGSGHGVWCPLVGVIRNDFRKSVPEPTSSSAYHDLLVKEYGRLYLSQGEMAITQMAFMGMALIYPEKFGIHNATEKDWEGFVHFWRCIGYMLGIDDKFNFCKGTVDETRRLTHEMMEQLIKPSFRDMSRDFEHMSRVMVTGSSYYMGPLTYETLMTFLGWIIGIELPGLWLAMTYFQRSHFYLMTFLFTVLYRLRWFVALTNKSARKLVKQTKLNSPRILQKYSKKVYTYESDVGILTTTVR